MNHSDAQQGGWILGILAQDRVVFGACPREVGGSDPGEPEQRAGIGKVRMGIENPLEQRGGRLRILGAEEGVGKVVGRVGIVRALPNLGCQQRQGAFEVMPANQRQPIIQSHLWPAASNA